MNFSPKKELLSMLPDELEALIKSIGEPAYRAKQIFPQLHAGKTPVQMTNISKKTCEALEQVAFCHFPEIIRRQVSSEDGTIKYLFGLHDGNCVESVLMEYKHGTTICISSQVGCRMGCAFCASTVNGLVRNLTAGELIGQIISAQSDSKRRISNIVMMGIGEPLDNYDNVIKFLKIVGHPDGLNIGYRHISLSSCGLCDKIRRLADESFPITLSISLHAPDDETRSSIMPVNKKWSISELLATCREYYAKTARRISFEYTLIAGKNDSTEDARRLASLLNTCLRRDGNGMPIHVNLIPLNPVAEKSFASSAKKAVSEFAATLESKGIRATVRRRLGPDIEAACGQLRRSVQDGQAN